MTSVTLYRSRWAMLAVYALVSLALQTQWLSFAPVAREAMAAYDATQFEIDLLSLIFMLVFVVMCWPASYLIDRFGVRLGVGIGAALLAVGALVKGLGAASYTTIVVAQVGLAMAQPLVLNAVTKLVAQWFPVNERATAVGLATLAQFVGIIVVMLLTPALVDRSAADFGLPTMLMTYGIASAAVAVLALVILRERPPTPPDLAPATERLHLLAGIRHMLAHRDMRLVFGLYFIGLGVFNAVSTCIDQLCAQSGLDADETGLVGGIMLIAGIVGAAVLPPLSDKRRQRRPFLMLATGVMAPALLAMTLASAFLPLFIAAAVLGFFLLGAGAPVGFQYAAEVSHPVAESISQGAILFVGQLSGIAFIIGINAVGIVPFMWVFVALGAVATLIATALRESPAMR